MMLIRLGLLLAALTFPSASLAAQSGAVEVEATIHQLFAAMRAADGDAAGALFHPEARLHRVAVQDGENVLVESDVAGFVEAIGTPRNQVWDERISGLEIRVDGGLATAWMNYAFYLDDEFSHCGVNALQLVRAEGRWRVLQITDTSRQGECEAPA